MAEEECMRFDPYHSTWEIVHKRIAELAMRLELNPEAMSNLYDQ
jgi:hypothetical protein